MNAKTGIIMIHKFKIVFLVMINVSLATYLVMECAPSINVKFNNFGTTNLHNVRIV